MTIKTCKTAVRASTLLAAIALSGGAFADAAAADSYNFETDGELGTSPYAALAGNGTVVAESYTAPRVGAPLTGDHTKVLEIAGTVTYTNAGDEQPTGSTSSQVDFMFKVEPTDELENPEGSDIQVALAVGVTNATGTTAPLKLWCKTSTSAEAGWATIKDSVNVGDWVRATLVLDYSETAKKCKISLDGDPVKNGDSEWFYFAGNASHDFVKSISMVGSTRIDDLKVSYDAAGSYALPGGTTTIADGNAITYEYINKYGVTVEEATSSTPLNAESDMTVADKFAAGLDPKSATKFAMQTMTSTSATAATITFPGNNGASGYEVTATADKAGTGTVLDTATITPGAANEAGETVNSAAFSNLPDNDLIYFHLKTK